MKFEPVVKSLLDTDLYKFNMQQVILHKHPDLVGEYHFKCRNLGVKFTKPMVTEINKQIDYLCTLSFTEEELKYLRSIRFIKPWYVEFLRSCKLQRDYISVQLLKRGELSVIVKGPMFLATHFEIYLLEIINEVYFRFSYNYDELLKSAKERVEAKIAAFKEGKYTFKFAEFGCRRRLSAECEEYAISRMAEEIGPTTEYKNLVGMSNVYFAMKYHLIPVGTYAHEYVQMYQGINEIPLAYTNHYAMKDWYDEYEGDNGTALTDTLTTDLFLMDFKRSEVNNFTGVRHDSGDPYAWGDKIIEHYKKFGVDPKTKTLLFSDSLDFDKAQGLYNYFKDRAKVSFGIGTFISNDTIAPPLNIVIKLQYVNDRPVAKLSDVDGKTMCSDSEYLEALKNSVKFRLTREV